MPSSLTQSRLRAAHDYLIERGVDFNPGLTEAELLKAERRYSFVFPPDLRWWLANWLPISDKFPDWDECPPSLEVQLNWPTEGILYDVVFNHYWRDAWGDRQTSEDAVVALARNHLRSVPKLIPVWNHSYLTEYPAQEGNPVLSVYQTDVIYRGRTLADYFFWLLHKEEELSEEDYPVYSEAYPYIPFWSDLAKENTE